MGDPQGTWAEDCPAAFLSLKDPSMCLVGQPHMIHSKQPTEASLLSHSEDFHWLRCSIESLQTISGIFLKCLALLPPEAK